MTRRFEPRKTVQPWFLPIARVVHDVEHVTQNDGSLWNELLSDAQLFFGVMRQPHVSQSGEAQALQYNGVHVGEEREVLEPWEAGRANHLGKYEYTIIYTWVRLRGDRGNSDYDF